MKNLRTHSIVSAFSLVSKKKEGKGMRTETVPQLPSRAKALTECRVEAWPIFVFKKFSNSKKEKTEGGDLGNNSSVCKDEHYEHSGTLSSQL